MKHGKFIAGLGLLSVMVLSVSAGEPIIFDHSSENTLPKLEFEPEKKLEDGTQFPNRKNSSVEAVVAPWQNPMNSGRLDAKQRKALMDALDKKQNWAFQSGEEYLGTANLDDADMAEDSFLSDGSSAKSASLRMAERVFYGDKNKKKSLNKLERTKRENRFNEDGDNLSDDNKHLTGEELLAKSGGMASPSFYQQQFDSLFQSGQTMLGDRGGESLSTMSQRDVTAATMLGMGALVPDQFKQSNPSSGRSQDFQSMIDSSFAGVSAQAPENALGGISMSGMETSSMLGNLAGAGGNPSINSGPFSGAMSSGPLNSSLESLGASRTFGGTPLDFGNSGFAPSSLGGGGFDPIARPSAAPSVQRPIFFEIPKRSF